MLACRFLFPFINAMESKIIIAKYRAKLVPLIGKVIIVNHGSNVQTQPHPRHFSPVKISVNQLPKSPIIVGDNPKKIIIASQIGTRVK